MAEQIRDQKGRFAKGSSNAWNKGKTYQLKPVLGYSSLHYRVSAARGKAAGYLCEGGCGRAAGYWATIHGRSGESPDDYVPLCSSCHIEYDMTPEWREKLRGRVPCPQCGRDIYALQLSRHIRTVHEGIVIPVTESQKQARSASGRRRVNCPECGKEVGILRLKPHIRSAHEGMEIFSPEARQKISDASKRRVTCEYCGRDIGICVIKNHIRTRHSEVAA